VIGALAALGGNPDLPADVHPSVLEAVARRDRARLDLEHATVRAPATGLVSQTDRLLVGQFLPVGTPALSLVETEDSWVEANFKETDLTHMAVGQAATVEFAAYPGTTFAARIDSIGAGTGSEFSLLPAQNATGNWVKVVQRVPVRLKLETTAPKLALRAGLSADVSVDTRHTRSLPSPIRSAFGLTSPEGLTEAEGPADPGADAAGTEPR
jgi:membrane fusion protein (multidrug efflux system)